MFVSLIARATRKTKTTVERDRRTPRKHHTLHEMDKATPHARARTFPSRNRLDAVHGHRTAAHGTHRAMPLRGRPPSADDARRRRRRQRRHRVPRAPSPSPSAALTSYASAHGSIDIQYR